MEHALFFLLLIISTSTSAGMDSSRHLLQLKTDCPFDFGTVDYTPITSVCKSPYPPEPCCGSFINVTCKYLDYFNNQNTTCADNMFAYLNSAGNYPGGLFSSLCVEGKEGLACPLAPSPSSVHRVGVRAVFFYLVISVWLAFMLCESVL